MVEVAEPPQSDENALPVQHLSLHTQAQAVSTEIQQKAFEYDYQTDDTTSPLRNSFVLRVYFYSILLSSIGLTSFSNSDYSSTIQYYSPVLTVPTTSTQQAIVVAIAFVVVFVG